MPKRRKPWRDYCGRKQPYTRKEAENFAAVMTRQDGFKVAYYKCPYGRHYHTGHPAAVGQDWVEDGVLETTTGKHLLRNSGSVKHDQIQV